MKRLSLSLILPCLVILAGVVQAADPCWISQGCGITVSPARACPNVAVPCPLPPIVTVPNKICAFPVAPCRICANIGVPQRICGGPAAPERICPQIVVPCRPMPAIAYPRRICTVYEAAPCQVSKYCPPEQVPR